MSADDSPQPTAHDLKLPSNAIARRSFMQRVGVGAAAITAGTASSMSAAAEDDEDDEPSNWDYVRDGTNGVHMLLTGRYATRAWGNYQDAQDEALHEEMYATAREIEEDRQNAFDSLENDLTMLSGWIRDNVANELANVAATDGSIEDMHDASKDVVRNNISNSIQNLFNVWVTDFEKTAKAIYEVDMSGYEPDPHMFLAGIASFDGVSGGSLTDQEKQYYDKWTHYHTDGAEGDEPPDAEEINTVNLSLPNGDSITLPVDSYVDHYRTGTSLFPFAEASDPDWGDTDNVDGSSDYENWHELAHKVVNPNDYDYQDDFVGTEIEDLTDEYETISRIGIYPYDATDDDRADILDAQRFTNIHKNLLELLEQELSHAETLVENLGQAMLDGEVSYHDVASGQAVLDAAADLEDWNDAAMFFRQVNTPEGEHAAVVELESGVELEGALFWTAPDPERGMPVGEWIEPEDELGEIHMGAEVHDLDEYDGDDWGEDWVGVTKITQQYRINGLDGGHDGPLMFDETELPDPQDTEAMLERIRDAYERERQAEEDAEITINLDGGDGGGGDPLFDFDNPLDSDGAEYLGLGLIGVVVLAVIGIVTDLIPGLGD